MRWNAHQCHVLVLWHLGCSQSPTPRLSSRWCRLVATVASDPLGGCPPYLHPELGASAAKKTPRTDSGQTCSVSSGGCKACLEPRGTSESSFQDTGHSYRPQPCTPARPWRGRVQTALLALVLGTEQHQQDCKGDRSDLGGLRGPRAPPAPGSQCPTRR